MDIDLDIENVKLSKLEEKVIISIFSIVIILGIFGNLLVIWTVLFNKQMRTSNNVIIINLAISDLILCFFSIPFNAYKTLRHTWAFGNFLCRLTPFFQATNVFVSSMSITAIALDRYIHIVCAVRLRQSTAKSAEIRTYFSMAICALIWVFAFLLSSPLFYYNTTTHISVSFNENGLHAAPSLETLPSTTLEESLLPFTSTTTLGTTIPLASSTTKTPSSQNLTDSFLVLDDNDYQLSIYHCVEKWQNHKTRMIYSYSSLLIQYILPIVIVGAAYMSIWWKLESHRSKLRKHTDTFSITDLNTKQAAAAVKTNTLNINDVHTPTSMNSKKKSLNNEGKNRRRKMNILLMSISIIFAVSWLPLNIFNILSDLKLSIIKPGHTYFLVNAICILLGMSSAVSNPCLYGAFNENFRRQYSRLFNRICARLVWFGKASSLDDAEPINENTYNNKRVQHSLKSFDKCYNKSAEQNRLMGNNNANNVNYNNSNSLAINNTNYHSNQKEIINKNENDLKEEIVNEMQ